MTFVLIHSPLVGPLTWKPVAERLRAGGDQVVLPVLADAEATGTPCWQQHAVAVAGALSWTRSGSPLILVGHSGSGALLPAARQAIGRSVAGYIFVDAGVHRHGLSRLEAMRIESPEFADKLRAHLEAGGHFPEWQDEHLREIVPDDRLRRALLAELQPRALDFFDEPIPVFAGWPDAPCAYLRFSPAYDRPAAHASAAGWPYRSFDAGHFHMLVAPDAVAVALIELAGELQTT